MLKPITQKYKDRSTERFFKFSFYCDRCGWEWTSEPYFFEHGFSENPSEEVQKAKEILWRADHDAAFERANLEARLRFSHCEICGKMVCDECLVLGDNENCCVDCAKKNNVVSHCMGCTKKAGGAECCLSCDKYVGRKQV